MNNMDAITTDPGMVAELRDGAQRLVRDKTDHRRTRALRQTLPGYAPEIVEQFKALGWFGILVPEVDGGIGLGIAEICAVLGELEKGLLAEPLLALGTLGVRTLVHCPAGALRGALLGEAAAGEILPALALDYDEAPGTVTAAPDRDGGFILNGCNRSVPGAAGASGFIIPASSAEGLQLFWLEAGVARLEAGWLADSTPRGSITLDHVTIPTACRLAGPGEAPAALAVALDETRLAAAASLVGLCEKMLDITVEYLKVREQFGQPIGSFQALQHKTVDLYIQKELAVATLANALDLAAADPGQLALAALRAKYRASETAARIGREAIHLHGAIGFTDEYDLGLYVKRAMVLNAWLGNAAVQRGRFVEMGLALQ
jgi:alkylation response protein AidB-like acyl-CoA dehydrogenase